jgi:hypothetical protein
MLSKFKASVSRRQTKVNNNSWKNNLQFLGKSEIELQCAGLKVIIASIFFIGTYLLRNLNTIENVSCWGNFVP